jgi:DUF917 family protein
MWQLRRDDLDTLATGAALLGSGGGGQPYWFRALAGHAFGERASIPIHDIDELPADMLVVATGLVGSLLSFHERIPEGTAFTRAVERVHREYPWAAACVANYESAGANIFAALVVGATGALPVVDCDGMVVGYPTPRDSQLTSAPAPPSRKGSSASSQAVPSTVSSSAASTSAPEAINVRSRISPTMMSPLALITPLHSPSCGVWHQRCPSTPGLGSSVTSKRNTDHERRALANCAPVPTGPTQLVTARN